MKYYNYPDQKIKLLDTFPHTQEVNECFFKNSVSALCCDWGGYIKEYDLSNPHSIPSPTIFNKTALSKLSSCMQTKDKRHIVAGGYQNKLYILDAEDGTIINTLDYPLNGPGYVFQIAKVRPNILITADYEKASLHDIRDIHSLKLPDIGKHYRSVIALESNPGDFALGAYSLTIQYGFVHPALGG